MREQTFLKQASVTDEAKKEGRHLSSFELDAIAEANHGSSFYDMLYSHQNAKRNTADDFQIILDKITGKIKNPVTEEPKKKDINGLIRKSGHDDNPYKRQYYNGAESRRLSHESRSSFSGSSGSESDRPRRTVFTKENSKILRSPTNVSSGSDYSGLIRGRGDQGAGIYTESDSEIELSTNKSGSNLKTKAAVKEFSQRIEKKAEKMTHKKRFRNKDKENRSSEEDDTFFRGPQEKSRSRENKHQQPFHDSRRDNITSSHHSQSVSERKKSRTDKTSDTANLLVPQRQAAKKAVEHMKGGTGKPEKAEQKEPDTIKMDISDTLVSSESEKELPMKSKEDTLAKVWWSFRS